MEKVGNSEWNISCKVFLFLFLFLVGFKWKLFFSQNCENLENPSYVLSILSHRPSDRYATIFYRKIRFFFLFVSQISKIKTVQLTEFSSMLKKCFVMMCSGKNRELFWFGLKFPNFPHVFSSNAFWFSLGENIDFLSVAAAVLRLPDTTSNHTITTWVDSEKSNSNINDERNTILMF